VIVEKPEDNRRLARFLAGIVPAKRLRELKTYLEERSRSLATAVLRQTAAYLFNIVVFPILTLLVLYWGAKYLISLSAPAQQVVQDPHLAEAIVQLSDAAFRLEKAVNETGDRETTISSQT
jgi:hypothetical protein